MGRGEPTSLTPRSSKLCLRAAWPPSGLSVTSVIQGLRCMPASQLHKSSLWHDSHQSSLWHDSHQSSLWHDLYVPHNVGMLMMMVDRLHRMLGQQITVGLQCIVTSSHIKLLLLLMCQRASACLPGTKAQTRRRQSSIPSTLMAHQRALQRCAHLTDATWPSCLIPNGVS